jgi:hypothetical protein
VLRRALFAIAALLVAGGLVLLVARVPSPGWNLLIAGVVLFAALVFERWRYRAGSADGGGQWHRTDERFEDPESGQIMEVHFDPASGRRRYVKAGERTTPPKGSR